VYRRETLVQRVVMGWGALDPCSARGRRRGGQRATRSTAEAKNRSGQRSSGIGSRMTSTGRPPGRPAARPPGRPGQPGGHGHAHERWIRPSGLRPSSSPFSWARLDARLLGHRLLTEDRSPLLPAVGVLCALLHVRSRARVLLEGLVVHAVPGVGGLGSVGAARRSDASQPATHAEMPNGLTGEFSLVGFWTNACPRTTTLAVRPVRVAGDARERVRVPRILRGGPTATRRARNRRNLSMTGRSIFLVRHAPTAANAARRFMG